VLAALARGSLRLVQIGRLAVFTIKAVYCDGRGVRSFQSVVTFAFAVWAAQCEAQSGAVQVSITQDDGTLLYSCMDGAEQWYGRKIPVC